jgi:NAD(P)-dependent dehydrogenase (short-subunit alcohol dehydrogenase family)
MTIHTNRTDGPVAIVTGGSGELGSAICRKLVGDGHRVVVAYHSSSDAAQSLSDTLGRKNVEIVQANLAERTAPAKILNAALERWETPTILVNNAGFMTRSPVADMNDEMWDELIDVNLSSAFRLTRELIPGMLEAGTGRIVNISSQAAHRGSVGRAHYAAAKAGLLGFTFALARELGPSGITVNAVSPGRIKSKMLNHDADEEQLSRWLAETPLGRLGTPEELASSVSYLVSSDASYITGAVIQVGGGLVMG